MDETVWEKSPGPFLFVPLNIRCSRKCARPDLPGVSSAEPTLYQIIWVTTGVRCYGITTTWRPLPRVKVAGRSEVTVVWASVPLAERANAGSSTAKSEAAKRGEDIMTCVKARTNASGLEPRHRTPHECPVSAVREPLRQPLTRTAETKG